MLNNKIKIKRKGLSKIFFWCSGQRLAFISIRSCRQTDSGKLFFICGRLRGAKGNGIIRII